MAFETSFGGAGLGGGLFCGVGVFGAI